MRKPYAVTVVVTYTSGEHIQECLTSLESQTLKGIEVIIIVDGQTNAKENEILNHFLQHCSNFRAIKNEQFMGKEYSRRRGILEAQGEYIGFLDKNNYASNDAFEKLYTCAKNVNCEIVATDYHNISNTGHSYTESEINSNIVKIYTGIDFFEFIISMIKKPFYIRTDWCNKIYKKDFFLKHAENLMHSTLNEETILLTISLTSKKIAIIDEKLITTISQKEIYSTYLIEKKINETITSAEYFKKELISINKIDEFYDAYIRFFYFSIFNKNIQHILSLKKEEINQHLDKLTKKINENLCIKIDFYRYLNKNEKHQERLLLSTINNSKSYDILRTAEETLIYHRKEGGKRLTERSKYKENRKQIVTIITICKDILKADRKMVFDKMLSTVMSQTYGRENIEHIVIDGNSRDGTTEYLELLSHDGKIDYWVSEPDSGIYNAMNKGVKHSFGEYIIFMNTDDYFSESAIEDLVSTITATNADYVFSNAIIIDEYDNQIGSHIGDINTVYYGSPYCHQTLLCKAACFAQVRFDESFKITMWSYAISLVTAGLKSSYIDKNLAFFRHGGVSTDSSHAIKFKDEQTKIKKEIIIPMLGIDHDEYEFLNHRLKKWERENIEVDKKNLHDKLLKMTLSDNDFQKKFAENTLHFVDLSSY